MPIKPVQFSIIDDIHNLIKKMEEFNLFKEKLVESFIMDTNGETWFVPDIEKIEENEAQI